MNELYFYFYNVAMVVSLMVGVSLLVLVWPRRRYPGALAMFFLGIGTLIWTFGYFMESNSTSLSMQLFFNNSAYIGSMLVPVAWLVFAIRYITAGHHPDKRYIILLLIIPIVVILLVWTNHFHEWMWSNERLATSGAFLITVKDYEIGFWLAIFYNYTLIIGGSLILLSRLFRHVPLFRGQVIALITAVLLPLIWNAVYVFDIVSLPRKDLTPVMFAFSGILIALNLLRFRLFEAIPFAYTRIIQQIKDGVMIFSTGDRLLDINPAARLLLPQEGDLTGKQPAEIQMAPALKERLLPVDDRGQLSLMIGGDNLEYEMNTVRIYDNNQRYLGWVTILHDITQLKRTEAVLNRLYAEEQFLRQKLETEIKKRSDFTRVLVHELKTPLTAIVTSTELLDEQLEKEQYLKINEVIRHSAQNLDKRISELLDFSQIEAGILNLRIEDTSSEILLQRVIQMVAPIVVSRNQKLSTDIPQSLPQIRVDPDRIQQVLYNLFDNAIKYNSSQGLVTLKATVEKLFLKISVTDTGAGIPKEAQSQLFSPYTRLQPSGGKGGGMGLGLAICKAIVEAHGGEVWLESTPGKGSTVSFRVPLSPTD